MLQKGISSENPNEWKGITRKACWSSQKNIKKATSEIEVTAPKLLLLIWAPINKQEEWNSQNPNS